MQTLSTKRFSDPDSLRRVGPTYLLELLAPHADFFLAKGLALPGEASAAQLDYDLLGSILLTPDESTPPDLAESLFYINALATDESMDSLIEAAEKYNIDLSLPLDPAPSDVAVRFWLKDKDHFVDVHNNAYLDSPRAFLSFVADADPLPPFKKPNQTTLDAIAKRLDMWFLKYKRGDGTRVTAHRRDGSCWFLIRHGESFKRDGTLNDGNPGNVFYRPQKHDVVIYDPAKGELRIHCKGKRLQTEYCKAFGFHLFGNESFFPGTAKYTLAPLTTGKDCLAVGAIKGIDAVVLQEVEFFWPGEHWERVVRKADNMFALFEKRKQSWPDADRITRATFAISFTGQPKPRRVTIRPSNKILYQCIDDAQIVEPWLEQQGFILEDTADEDAESAMAVS